MGSSGEEIGKFFEGEVTRIMTEANRLAITFRSMYVEPEHIFLAILRLPETKFYKMVLEPQVTKAVIHRWKVKVEKYIRERFTRPFEKEFATLSYSSRTKKVLVHAGKVHPEADLKISSIAIVYAILDIDESATFIKSLLLDEDIDKELLEEILYEADMDSLDEEEEDEEDTPFPMLEKFGVDLTRKAEKGELFPLIGREKELKRIVQILSKKLKNNPVLIGDPGVGKTAIVEGLAQRIAEGRVPDVLKGKRIIALNLSGLVAGTKYRGEFEERMERVIREIINSKDQIIVFIDEIHNLVGAGSAEGSLDASNIIKPYLARGEIKCIGATTVGEYRRYIEKSPALERRFEPVLVKEPTVEETVKILRGLKKIYEEHHGVVIKDEAIRAASEFSARYIKQRCLPDKAIDVLDESCAYVKLKGADFKVRINVLTKELNELKERKERATREYRFGEAERLKELIEDKLEKINELKAEWKKAQKNWVDDSDVAEVVSMWTGVPVEHMLIRKNERIVRMKELMAEELFGQDHVIEVVSNVIVRAYAGLARENRPIGAFLFLGPTGVGKTYTAKIIAKILFGSEDRIIRIDMSEYRDAYTVSRLTGAPPGYVGYDQGGQLTEAVRRDPYSVVVFDEVEKAHPDVVNLLLQILEEGELTDGQGVSVSFKNTVIVLTSNVGSEKWKFGRALGFSSGGDERDLVFVRKEVERVARKFFRPELLARLDEIVVFNTLGREQLYAIAKKQVDEFLKWLRKNGVRAKVGEEVVLKLVVLAEEKKEGARPVRRLVKRYLEEPLAYQLLLLNEDEKDVEFHFTVRNGDIVLEKRGERVGKRYHLVFEEGG